MMLVNPAVRTPIAIGLGAIAGALSRYYVGLGLTHWLKPYLGTTFPYSTLTVNLTGCLAMGILVALLLHWGDRIHPDARVLLTTGFLGSYTTFSTYELDMAKLLQQHTVASGLLYGAGSAGLGLACLYLGMGLTEKVLQYFSRP